MKLVACRGVLSATGEPVTSSAGLGGSLPEFAREWPDRRGRVITLGARCRGPRTPPPRVVPLAGARLES